MGWASCRPAPPRSWRADAGPRRSGHAARATASSRRASVTAPPARSFPIPARRARSASLAAAIGDGVAAIGPEQCPPGSGPSFARAQLALEVADEAGFLGPGLIVSSEHLPALILHRDPALLAELADSRLGPLRGETELVAGAAVETLQAPGSTTRGARPRSHAPSMSTRRPRATACAVCASSSAKSTTRPPASSWRSRCARPIKRLRHLIRSCPSDNRAQGNSARIPDIRRTHGFSRVRTRGFRDRPPLDRRGPHPSEGGLPLAPLRLPQPRRPRLHPAGQRRDLKR